MSITYSEPFFGNDWYSKLLFVYDSRVLSSKLLKEKEFCSEHLLLAFHFNLQFSIVQLLDFPNDVLFKEGDVDEGALLQVRHLKRNPDPQKVQQKREKPERRWKK